VALFRWALLLAGLCILVGIFAYSRGWLNLRLPKFSWRKRLADETPAADAEQERERVAPQPPPVKPPPILSKDSMVVTVRIMPQPGESFPAEQLVLIMRGTGLQHGKYGIFHSMDVADPSRIRYSVASLVEPGAFDLTKLKESFYKGVSIFMVLPVPEDGVSLFDEMLETARTIARGASGRLVDEDGSVLSVQRERYMREEVIDFVRRQYTLPISAD
jgi:FtsZ-interacting cell division protein ZipA